MVVGDDDDDDDVNDIDDDKDDDDVNDIDDDKDDDDDVMRCHVPVYSQLQESKEVRHIYPVEQVGTELQTPIIN